MNRGRVIVAKGFVILPSSALARKVDDLLYGENEEGVVKAFAPPVIAAASMAIDMEIFIVFKQIERCRQGIIETVDSSYLLA